MSMLSNLKDKFGRLFKPGFHRLKPDGSPFIGRFGQFMPRGGRKKKNKTMIVEPTATTPHEITGEPTPSKPPVEISAEVPSPASAPNFDDVKKALESHGDGGGTDAAATPEGFQEELLAVADNPTAETIIGLIQTALIFIGEEEGMLSPVEKTMIRRPLERVMKKYNLGKNILPAEMDLVLAVLGVVAVRMQKPKTAKWAQKVKAWFVDKFFANKARKMATTLEREVGASVNPR